jgi:GT2 family glycosyltransferase
MNTVVVGVLTHSGGPYLAKCLGSLPPSALAFVVADKPDADTRRILTKFAVPTYYVDFGCLEKAANFMYQTFLQDFPSCFNFIALQDDMWISPSFVEELEAMAQRKPDGSLFVGHFYNWDGSESKHSYTGPHVEPMTFTNVVYGDEEKEAGWGNYFGALSTRNSIERILPFAPEFDNSYTDLDFSLRVREANFKIYYCPRAKVYHKENATLGTADERCVRMWRNRAYATILHRPGAIYDVLTKDSDIVLHRRFGVARDIAEASLSYAQRHRPEVVPKIKDAILYLCEL